jgi:AcrR family transcriptional regulator
MSTQTVDRRARILAATIRLVGRKGLVSITTRKIAHEAGVNLSAVHRNFSSKDTLLVAALEETTTLMIAALPASPGANWGDYTAVAKTCASLGVLVDAAPHLPLVRCELLLYLRRHPGLDQEARHQHARYLAAVTDRFGGSADGDEQARARYAFAELVTSMVDGLALRSASLDARHARGQPAGRALRAVSGHSRIGDRS